MKTVKHRSSGTRQQVRTGQWRFDGAWRRGRAGGGVTPSKTFAGSYSFLPTFHTLNVETQLT